jgi:hypothetical protein
MKKIITLTMVLVMMLVSLGGCYPWRDKEITRQERLGNDSKIFDSQGYDRGEGHDHNNEHDDTK